MNVAEMKETIISQLDKMSETELIKVVHFIERLNEVHVKKWDVIGLAEKVIKERVILLNELTK